MTSKPKPKPTLVIGDDGDDETDQDTDDVETNRTPTDPLDTIAQTLGDGGTAISSPQPQGARSRSTPPEPQGTQTWPERPASEWTPDEIPADEDALAEVAIELAADMGAMARMEQQSGLNVAKARSLEAIALLKPSIGDRFQRPC